MHALLMHDCRVPPLIRPQVPHTWLFSSFSSLAQVLHQPRHRAEGPPRMHPLSSQARCTSRMWRRAQQSRRLRTQPRASRTATQSRAGRQAARRSWQRPLSRRALAPACAEGLHRSTRTEIIQ